MTRMIGRRFLTLSASAALHLGAVGLALTAAGAGAGSTILVDLVAGLAGQPVPDARHRAPGPSIPGRAEWAPTALTARAAPEPAPDRSPALSASTTAVALSDQEPPGSAPVPEVERPAEPPPNAESSRRLAVAAAPGRAAAEVSPEGVKPGEGGAGTVAPAGSGADGGGATGGQTRAASVNSMAGPGLSGRPGGDGSAVALATPGARPGGVPPEYAPYLQRFRHRVEESIHYPLAARRQGLSGTVELDVLLEPSGHVAAARVAASSSHAVLDEAALQAVKRLSAEPFPELLPRRPLRIRLPFAFELQ